MRELVIDPLLLLLAVAQHQRLSKLVAAAKLVIKQPVRALFLFYFAADQIRVVAVGFDLFRKDRFDFKLLRRHL